MSENLTIPAYFVIKACPANIHNADYIQYITAFHARWFLRDMDSAQVDW
jgi:hypothetical protein